MSVAAEIAVQIITNQEQDIEFVGGRALRWHERDGQQQDQQQSNRHGRRLAEASSGARRGSTTLGGALGSEAVEKERT